MLTQEFIEKVNTFISERINTFQTAQNAHYLSEREARISELQTLQAAMSGFANSSIKGDKAHYIDADAVHQDFVNEVYRILDADSTNDRANQIIDCFDSLPLVSIPEPPTNDDLKKEIDKYFSKWWQGASDEGCINADSQLVSIYDCQRIARHFAQWQKEQMMRMR